ncbi:hypothetical protein BDW72DRAFT_175973 [Aspergillus terricola var. indicus]
MKHTFLLYSHILCQYSAALQFIFSLILLKLRIIVPFFIALLKPRYEHDCGNWTRAERHAINPQG